MALLVGIDEYDTLPDLPLVAADVARMHEVLAGPGGFELRRATGADAAELRASIALATAGLGPDDLLLVYLAGHGVEVPRSVAESGSVLFLAAATEGRCDANWLSVEEIDRIGAAGGAGTRVYLADACRAVQLSDSVPGLAECLRLPSEFPAFPASPRAVFAATDAGELAREEDALGNGLFTAFAALGLQGAADADTDGEVGVQELGEYLQGAVAAYSCGRQHATLALATNVTGGVLARAPTGGWPPLLVDDRVDGCVPAAPVLLDGEDPRPGPMRPGRHRLSSSGGSGSVRVAAGGRYTVAAWTAEIARERGGWVEVAPAVGAAVVLDSARQAWRPLVVGGELSFVPPDVAGGRPLFRVALAAQDARFGYARLFVPSLAAGWRWGGALYGGPTLAVGAGIVDDEGNAWVPRLEGGGEVGVRGRYVWASVAAGGALGVVDDGAGAVGLAWPWTTLRLGLRVVTGQR